MLTVTDKAAAVLKAAKTVQGAPPGTMPDDSGKPALAAGFAISDNPAPNDEELQQNGLRIFVEDALVEPLQGRTIDVREDDDGPQLIFR